jgi:two-component system, cell cycle sensor histidine kinase and response regulator CckA
VHPAGAEILSPGLMANELQREGAEAALSASEERFQAIFAQAAVGIAQIGLDGAWLLVNSRFCQMLGYSEAELRRRTLQDITHPDDSDESLKGRRQLLAGEILSHTMEKRYIRQDGTIFWGRLHRSLVRDQGNLPKYFIAVVEDITEKIQAERALRDSEQRLMLAQNAAQLGVWDRDLRANEIVISGKYDKLYGLPTGHRPLTYEEWLNLIHSEDRERVRELMSDTIKRTHVWDAEFRVVWPDGSIHWLLGKGTVFLDNSGRPVRITGVNLDITERKQAAAALVESEERFRNMADTAPVMIWVSGTDKLCTFFNKGWLTFTGRTMEQEMGNGWASCVHPEDLDRCLEIYSSSFDARRNFQMEYRLRRADGEYRWMLDNGVPRGEPGGAFAGYIGSCIDITDLKRTQDEGLARQKLESLGVLAGGIAHDFNNLLGGILAEAELVESDLAAGLPAGEEITRIKAVAIRGAEIVRELMIFAGQDQASLAEPVDLSRLVEEMLELLKVSISKQVVLQVNLDQNLPAVFGNAPQIRQVLMNLVINASEAIGEQAGVIHVGTSRVTGRQGSGQYVRLEVSDTGSGMTEEAKAKIFDPFFTTKFVGRGLGLAVVQGIVRDHGGTINVVSTPGRGATFQVLLPCSLKRVLRPSAGSSTGAEQANNRVGTILIVEDEELLRIAVSKALRKRGFSVIEASDGSAGMELMQKHKDDIDVILLDVTLPGRSSREILDEVRRIRPNLKVILTSAYDRNTVEASFTGLPITSFIRKPFQLSDLAGMLQDALSN